MQSTKYNRLIDLLNKMFQMDQEDLDFGIYRIMNQKREEINKFLREDLLTQVQDELEQYDDGSQVELQRQLQEARAQAREFVTDESQIDQTPKVQQLLKQIDQRAETDDVEESIYSYLTDFFGRYYDGGDFLSKRRYKEGTYAIPYEGEEVKLHWANHDQFYIKTAENFTNYTFKIDGGKRVIFEIIKVSTERDNNKGDNRYFQLATDEFNRWQYEFEDDTLRIYFQYLPLPGRQYQHKMNEETAKTILNSLNSSNLKDFIGLAQKAPTEKNSNRTILEKHLSKYTTSNEFDYFIHKDLYSFLSRELDFYIKNEILHIDDLDTNNDLQILMYLSQVKVFKRISNKIIAFLVQIEEFQKTMWLKKKFVVQSEYCMTLHYVDEEFYPDIISNPIQIQEWRNLGYISSDEEISIEYLKNNQNLVIDTAFLPDLRNDLLSKFDNLDQAVNGYLINSENFQALHFLQNRYRDVIDFVYIDPPYNTDSTPIVYKNGYRHSSWATLMNDRLALGKQLLNNHGSIAVAIDDTEMVNLSIIFEDIFNDFRHSRITVVHNPKGSITKDFNRVHEYVLFATPEHNKEAIARTLEENDSPRKMRRWGANSARTDRRLSFYPIYVRDGEIVEIGEVPKDDFHPNAKNIMMEDGTIAIYPIDQNGVERRWNFGLDSIEENLDRIIIQETDDGLDLFISHELTVPKTVWKGGQYDAGKWGNTLLVDILGEKLFDFPKSINLVERCVYLTTKGLEESTIVDYFAGSGTTAHAVINLNRRDNGNRKYLLVEMGSYFDSVTKPRVMKIIHSDEWREGRPQSKIDDPHLVKYLKLESYEDTLNNLVLKRTDNQQMSLEQSPQFREEYMLSYMLDIETRDSKSLVNIFDLAAPFSYKLRIQSNDNEILETNIDVVETFNYLLGIHVKTYYADTKLAVVTGYSRLSSENILIIWRNMADVNDKKLTEIYQQYEGKTFDRVYINGDNTIEANNIHLIEDTFATLMFS